MQTKLLLLLPGQEPEERHVDLPCVPSFHELRAMVEPLLGGAYMERVNVWLADEQRYTDMFVDETGSLKDLPVNGRATMVYWANTMVHEGRQPDSSWPKIHGPAVLFARKVWF